MDYVINKTVIEAAIGGNKYTTDLLMPFASNNIPHRVVINSKILDEYSNVADINIRTWINLVTCNDYWAPVPCNEEPIFIKTCKLTYDKKLIVDNKNNDYQDYEELIPIDKDEAIDEILPNSNVIIQTGNNNTANIES